MPFVIAGVCGARLNGWASMKIGLFLVVTLITACAATPTLTPQTLTGRWVLAPEATALVPTGCHDISLEFVNDRRLITTSGRLVFETEITSTSKDGGLVITQRFLNHNGQPNCQGITADYVRDHLAPTLFIEPVGEMINCYMLSKANGPPLLMKRVDAQQRAPGNVPRPAGSGRA